MNYHSLKPEEKESIRKEIRQHYPDVDIDIDKIQVESISNGFKISYKDIDVVMPIKAADQETSNDILKFLTGGAVAIAAVAVTLFFGKR